ncbi:MAG: hypothetical protein H9901_00970 [Candidatus Paralactobacillus gallistercoris]|uniref:Uncharacterized protein n=1 Tax=Candidatus Paralactobacillus gallistercoris TaxID=2838724 RepID=A0A948TJ70_9LACO|nr:hypothetical protein [Candidatus Paralactobacillus gallistercoris]
MRNIQINYHIRQREIDQRIDVIVTTANNILTSNDDVNVKVKQTRELRDFIAKEINIIMIKKYAPILEYNQALRHYLFSYLRYLQFHGKITVHNYRDNLDKFSQAKKIYLRNIKQR